MGAMLVTSEGSIGVDIVTDVFLTAKTSMSHSAVARKEQQLLTYSVR